MRARAIASSDVLRVVDLLRRDHEVIAPFYGLGRDTCFDTVTDENRQRIQVHLPNPYYPPKRFVLPHIQRLLQIHVGRREDGAGQGGAGEGGLWFEPTYEEKKRAIFGIRSCDVAGVYHMDRFFLCGAGACPPLGGTYRDVYYERFRKNLFLVNVVCSDQALDIDDDCFCTCADTGPAAREHFDLQLMDLGDCFLVLAGSAKGEALFADPAFQAVTQKATPEMVEERRRILEDVRKRFKNAVSWYSAAIRHVTRGGVSEETWEEIGNRCFECGGCSYVCPTCSCFTVTDRAVRQGEFERLRIWDSCALGGFTRMAGGHNPRKAVHDRRNRRFFHKLDHYFIERQLSVSCVGCGRCVSVCHGDVGMPSVVEILRRKSAASREERHA